MTTLGPTMSHSLLRNLLHLFQCPGRFLGIIGQNPRVPKSKWWHVVIFWVSFINLKYILYIPLKWSVISLKLWTSTGYLCNSTSSSVTSSRFTPFTDLFTHKRWFCFSITKKATYWISFLKLRRHLHPQECVLQVRNAGTPSKFWQLNPLSRYLKKKLMISSHDNTKILVIKCFENIEVEILLLSITEKMVQ
jgi:hypothetical protein